MSILFTVAADACRNTHLERELGPGSIQCYFRIFVPSGPRHEKGICVCVCVCVCVSEREIETETKRQRVCVCVLPECVYACV